MPTLCTQTVVSGKTVQVVLVSEAEMAKIFIVENDGQSLQPRTIDVHEYIKSGLSDDEILRRIVEVVAASIEQLDRIRPH